MPGPVSDSYDPEFGTGANAHEVRTALEELEKFLTQHLGTELKDIVEVAKGENGRKVALWNISERNARLLRFALRRATESI